MNSRSITPALLSFLLVLSTATAQFQFFGDFFGQQGQQQGHPQEKQNVASDSNWYRQTWEDAHCTHFLCPGTLACVHFPHHCPCPFPDVEDKVELGDGSMVCISKGGYKEGEAGRKIELARKGVL